MLFLRKGLHVLLVAAVAGGLWFGRPVALVLCAAAFVGILTARAHPSLTYVRTLHPKSVGDLFLPVGLFLTVLLHPDATLASLAAPLVIVGVADVAASMVGMHYGVHRFRVLGEWRSIEGSAAFALVTVCALAPSAASFSMACGAAAVLTGIELLSVRGSDNLTLPLTAAYLVTLV